MIRKTLVTLSFLTVFAGISATSTLADYQTPAFTTCGNPQGSIIANYATGDHAIAGQNGSVNGSDTVYALDANNNAVTQCYCPPTDTTGIQTNWLHVDNMSQADIQSLENNGWVYITNGADWGLSGGPYLAQDITYTCNSSTPSTPTITATVQSVEVSNSSSTSPSNNAPAPTGLILPNTGGSVELFEYLGAGILLLAIGFLFKKIASN